MKIDREIIAQKLNEKGATAPCSRCGGKQFSAIEGISQWTLQNDIEVKGLIIGGPSLPVTFIVCNNCGAIVPHAIGALGLLPKEEGNKNE